jgi:hypothetical protein
MKTLKNSKFGCALFLFLSGGTLLLSAQTYSEAQSNEELVINNELGVEALGILGINTQENPKLGTIQGNSVFLRQIGDFNQVNINTQTSASEIELTQTGEGNLTELRYNVQKAVATLNQLGNSNIIRDFVNAPNENISLNLTQEGNQLQFERFGVNSMTKNIQLKQTDASPQVIIRSF